MAVFRRQITEPRAPHEYNPDIAAFDARRIAVAKNLMLMPLDVVGLSTSIGIPVDILPLASDISGYFRQSEADGVRIGVNSLHHPNRRRFTVAHELGHFFLHRAQGDFEDGLLFRREYQTNPREYEANEFAAKLLMPTLEFRREAAACNYDFTALAQVFGVSVAAAEYRNKNITSELPID